MAKTKKYYWLKLDRGFFKRHDMQIIEKMPNGEKYVLFYLKLLCESIDHNGKLRFSDTIPYDEGMLATITQTDIDVVRSAVKLFTNLHMMEIFDDGTYYMGELINMVGNGQTEEIQRIGAVEEIGLMLGGANKSEEETSDIDEFTILADINTTLESIKKLYEQYGYEDRYTKTETKKRLLILLNGNVNVKPINIYGIIWSYIAYLNKCSENNKETQYVVLSSIFLTKYLADYYEKDACQNYIAESMQKKYGNEWQKFKFKFK